MSLVQENFMCENGTILVYTHSDNNKMIRQIETGVIYDEAYDIPNRYTYEETNIERETEQQEPTEEEGTEEE